MTDLRYPIGKFQKRDTLSASDRAECVRQIAEAPALIRAAVAGLDDAQLETPYRPDGWTVRQVVHHVPDSHMNAYIRCKFALTEENPTVKPYDEAAWAGLYDARTAPIEASLTLLESLHERWILLLRSMGEAEFRRTLFHPENGPMTLDAVVQLYAWHGRHHTAHITVLRQRNDW
jgi:uncharacterized damage-inducible protein DinB